MSVTDLNRRISELSQGATEGLKVRAFVKGRCEFSLENGRVYKYYDFASLTKIIFTVTAFMKLFEQKKIGMQDRVVAYLNWYPHAEVKIGDLLCHGAGHRAWTGFYESLINDKDPRKKSFSERMQPLLQIEPLVTPGQNVYSDIDFLILGCLLEKVTQLELVNLWGQLKIDLKLNDTDFSVDNFPKFSKQEYAPTEKCLWRKNIIQGEVHDDNTWALGGVSSHAGLFGSLEDLEIYGLGLRQIYLGSKGYVLPDTLQHFTKAANAKGDWGLGFMKPSRPKSSAGSYFSSDAFGHTGFTGTSVWFDPKVDLLVLILSNRTYPDRNNFKFRDEVRPHIHDWIYEEFI